MEADYIQHEMGYMGNGPDWPGEDIVDMSARVKKEINGKNKQSATSGGQDERVSPTKEPEVAHADNDDGPFEKGLGVASAGLKDVTAGQNISHEGMYDEAPSSQEAARVVLHASIDVIDPQLRAIFDCYEDFEPNLWLLGREFTHPVELLQLFQSYLMQANIRPVLYLTFSSLLIKPCMLHPQLPPIRSMGT